MNAWGDEDLPPVGPAPRKRRMHGWHAVALGVVVLAVGAVVTALSPIAVGPMLMVLGVFLAAFGGMGWLFESLGAFDDDPQSRSEIGLLDLVRMPTRLRRH